MTEAVYVLGAKRTPIGSFLGALAPVTASQLGARAIGAAIDHAGIDADSIDEVLMGCVVSAGLKQAPARQAMRLAGIPDATGATTVNKVCGSGMKTAMLGTDLIRAGSARRIVAGGMESMTNAPYLIAKARAGLRIGHGEMADSMFLDGLEDAETGGSMGSFAQSTADTYQFTRESMDEFAIGSVTKALAAMDGGSLANEVAPMTIGDAEVTEDEQPRRAKIDRIPSLRPAFKKDGTITAANASSISDGASALVLAGESALDGATPLARVVGHVTHSIHPSDFTIAPVGAITALLDKVGWTKDDVDVFEINEAFAMVTMLAIQELNLDPAKVNLYGGACAQGHPIGSTGSRLIVTLIHALAATGGTRGVAALCIGGGEATAFAIERV
ncbi:MAG: thiolase family protein [Gammaproteobacteria bacterium]|nr:thiolase family protein [Gammaproteobacteria bacterium]